MAQDEPGVSIAVVGGGAAGFFAAIAAAEAKHTAKVEIFEATRQFLYKVGISGGGRCNVTHSCYETSELLEGYPRGSKELKGVFRKFNAVDTVKWFRRSGVELKIEEDGRIFPISNDSETIIKCLVRSARERGVIIHPFTRVQRIDRGDDNRFKLAFKKGTDRKFDRVIICTGSSPPGYKLAAAMGHSIVPCVPSLFTFKIKDKRIEGLQGISLKSVRIRMTAGDTKMEQTEPALITHWGLSGPAVLKLSAWGARALFLSRYRADLEINWLGDQNFDAVVERLRRQREHSPRKGVASTNIYHLPMRLWERFVQTSGISRDVTWSQVTKESSRVLAEELAQGVYQVDGKGEFKEEFVTCGGVKLKEVDFNTMESKVCPGLFLAGEILDIDGITGGYNFQSAWSTGWLAGRSAAGVRSD